MSTTLFELHHQQASWDRIMWAEGRSGGVVYLNNTANLIENMPLSSPQRRCSATTVKEGVLAVPLDEDNWTKCDIIFWGEHVIKEFDKFHLCFAVDVEQCNVRNVGTRRRRRLRTTDLNSIYNFTRMKISPPKNQKSCCRREAEVISSWYNNQLLAVATWKVLSPFKGHQRDTGGEYFSVVFDTNYRLLFAMP